MAVAAIKSISIIGLMEHLSEVTKVCGASESFQPDNASSFYADTRNFFPITTKNDYAAPLEKLRNALDLAKIDRKIIDTKQFEPNVKQLNEYVNNVTQQLQTLVIERSKAENDVEKCRRSIEETSHFLGLDVELDKVFACEYIKANFGRLPKESFEKLSSYENNPYVTFFPCTVDDTHYWGVYISPVDESLEIDRIFSGLFFEHYQIEGMQGTPEEYYQHLQSILPQLENAFDKANKNIADFEKANIKEILNYYSKLEQLNTYCSITSRALRYHNSFVLVGWIPADMEDDFRKKLSNIDSIEFSLNDGKNELKHSPPVKLKNFFLAKPFEFYTEMYGLPRYNEIDPTKFIALTYSILFGIMFGDVGHGLLLLLAAWLMWKLKKMPIGKILIPCAICSTIFGFIFGSVFGFEDVLDPVYKAIFGWEGKPIHVMEAKDTNMIIYSAVGIGIFLLIVAMCLSIYSNIKRGNIGQALFGVNGLSGLVFYSSIVVGLIGQIIMGAKIMTPMYVICLIIVPLILVFLNEPLSKLVAGNKNWQPKSWGVFISENIFECFEVVLSYVTNTMSFLRVGAFVLVHAGMMEVVFVLAQMVGGPGYWITVVLGNLVVMGLEALLVGIQVLRLEYYEMFSRFYIGDGRAFEPVKVKQIQK